METRHIGAGCLVPVLYCALFYTFLRIMLSFSTSQDVGCRSESRVDPSSTEKYAFPLPVLFPRIRVIAHGKFSFLLKGVEAEQMCAGSNDSGSDD